MNAAGIGLPARRGVRRPDRRAVWVALGCTVVVNGALYALLLALQHQPPEPAAPSPVVRRLAVVPPTPPLTPLAAPPVPAVTAAVPVASVSPVPLLPLPELSTGLQLPLATLPTVAYDRLATAPVPLAADDVASGAAQAAPAGIGSATGAPVSDQAPFLVNGFDLQRFYPRAARLRGVEGSTTLRLQIDAAGTVAAVEVVAGDPPGVFDQAAQNLGFSMKFLPARAHGLPVAATILQQIAWRLPR
jgi:protein TonB